MIIIPAIDIMGARVVRLERGRFDKEKIYSESPVMVAKEWKKCGAKLLHVVDLDGARLGKPVNLEIVGEIVKAAGIDIELGGGLRTIEDIDSAFRRGAHYVVIGTSAVKIKKFREEAAKKFAGRVIFAVDVKDGRVAVEGWKKVSGESALRYIAQLETLGAKRIIYTDISRDGMMQGPNLDMLKSILQATSLEIAASGGISSIDDIKALKKLEKDGLKAVIIGKALYEKKIDLAEAISVS